ncbi:hypothetical protein D3C73_1373560 [compost metagenome]
MSILGTLDIDTFESYEPASDTAELVVVDVEGVPRFSSDRTCERATQNYLASFEGDAVRSKFIGQPSHAFSWMIEHCCTDARFLNHAIAVKHCPHLAQINIGCTNSTPA